MVNEGCLDGTAQAEHKAASPDFCLHIQPVCVTKFQSVGLAILPRFLLFQCHLSFLFLLLWLLLFCKLFSWFGKGRYSYWRWPVVLPLAKCLDSKFISAASLLACLLPYLFFRFLSTLWSSQTRSASVRL